MDYLAYQNWTFPVPIRYGPGRINELSEICQNKGIKKPLVVTDNGSKNLKFIENILTDRHGARRHRSIRDHVA